MAPITTASNEETHAALLDTLDMQKVAKPFRNPNWKAPQRRNKNLKQILSETSRAQQSLMTTQQNSGASTPLPVASTAGSSTPAVNLNAAQASQDMSRLVLEKNARQANGNGGTGVAGIGYTSIAAAPSLKPKKKYCDVTGLPAKYKDPQFGMYYYNAEVYGIIKGMNTQQRQDILRARGAETVLNKIGTIKGDSIAVLSTAAVRPTRHKPILSTSSFRRRLKNTLRLMSDLCSSTPATGYRRLWREGKQTVTAPAASRGAVVRADLTGYDALKGKLCETHATGPKTRERTLG